MLFSKVINKILVLEGDGHLTGKSFDPRGLPKHSAGFSDNNELPTQKKEWNYDTKGKITKQTGAVKGSLSAPKEIKEKFRAIFTVLQDIAMKPEVKAEFEQLIDPYVVAHTTKMSVLTDLQQVTKMKETTEKQLLSIVKRWKDSDILTAEEIKNAAFIYTNDRDDKIMDAIQTVNKLKALVKAYTQFKNLFRDKTGQLKKDVYNEYLALPPEKQKQIDDKIHIATDGSDILMRLVMLHKYTVGGEKQKIVIDGINDVERDEKGKIKSTALKVKGTLELQSTLDELNDTTSIHQQNYIVDDIKNFISNNIEQEHVALFANDAIDKISELIAMQQDNSLFNPEKSDIVMRIAGLFRAAINRAQKIANGDFKPTRYMSPRAKTVAEVFLNIIKKGVDGFVSVKGANQMGKVKAKDRYFKLLENLKTKEDPDKPGQRYFKYDDVIQDLWDLGMNFYLKTEDKYNEKFVNEEIRRIFEYCE